MPTVERDQRQRFLFDNLSIRGELVRLDASLQALLANHAYPAVVATQVGEALAAVALLAATVKLDGALILQLEGDGPMRLLVAQATSDNKVRATAQYDAQALQALQGDQAQLPLHQLTGTGRMVMTIDARGSERYQGIVELAGETIADALGEYFARSEQLPTRLWLCTDGKSAAGLLLQQLPSDDDAAQAEKVWEHIVTLADTITPDELLQLPFATILTRLFHEETVRIFAPEGMAFRCTCSRSKLESVLLAMGEEELAQLLNEQGSIDARCDFCFAHYRFDSVDVAALVRAALPAQHNQ